MFYCGPITRMCHHGSHVFGLRLFRTYFVLAFHNSRSANSHHLSLWVFCRSNAPPLAITCGLGRSSFLGLRWRTRDILGRFGSLPSLCRILFCLPSPSTIALQRNVCQAAGCGSSSLRLCSPRAAWLPPLTGKFNACSARNELEC
jgi:hypothetical protein